MVNPIRNGGNFQKKMFMGWDGMEVGELLKYSCLWKLLDTPKIAHWNMTIKHREEC